MHTWGGQSHKPLVLPSIKAWNRSPVPSEAWQLCLWDYHPAVTGLVSILPPLHCPPVLHLEGLAGHCVGTEDLLDAFLLRPCSACSPLPQNPTQPVSTTLSLSSALVPVVQGCSQPRFPPMAAPLRCSSRRWTMSTKLVPRALDGLCFRWKPEARGSGTATPSPPPAPLCSSMSRLLP